MEDKTCICGKKARWWQMSVPVSYTEYCHIPNGCCGTIALYMHKKCYSKWKKKLVKNGR